MRLVSIAAGILAIILAGYPAVTSEAVRADAAPVAFAQVAGPGPLIPGGTRPPQTAQPPVQPLPEAPEPLQVRTTLVNVFATVRGRHNAIVSDLTKNDFKVYEDGVEQKIAYFSKEVNMPITLGLLIDTSGSMSRTLDEEKQAAVQFIKEVLRKKDEAMVISFDLDVNLLADFTEDKSVLDRAIERAQINAAGPVITPGTIPQNGPIGTDLYDALYLACHDKLATEAGRKAVVVLTDAEDNGSKMSLSDAIEAAQRADTVIHVILITDPMATTGVGPGVARQLAGQTGGRVIYVHNGKGMQKAFDEISQELRSQYVLGYYPTNSKRDGTFRKIKVEVTQPHTKVLARKGYYAPYH